MKLGSDETEKKKFHSCRKEINVYNVEFEKILVSDEFDFDKNKETDSENFIGYKINGKIRPLSIKLPQLSGCLNKDKNTHYMSFAIKDKKLLEKYELDNM